MDETDESKYIERYNERLKKYGYDPKTLGWSHGRERQYLRFEKLLEAEKFFENKKIRSVLDVGCGFGDLGVYLNEQYPKISYHGTDINPRLIEEGLKHNPGLNLTCGDIFEKGYGENQFDLVVESGVFNYELTGEKNQDYIKRSLREFYSIATLGVAADFMTTYVDFISDSNFHLSPEEAYTIARSISSKVVVRSDYLEYEFMIYLIKNNQGSQNRDASKH